ncbi:unnamed protein product [Rotaria sordida]|uniref:Uncharacterized protein n=2 Tax=Rotaria sordida TaxID=392033 RepID=A0A815H9T4_9BILA|nr:unnamed protein product [Rotaria sordida]
MLPSTFEILPDEILMIIIRYSGDIYTIFRTFSGLNQRINNILVDKRMHLLTDFLFVDTSDVNIDYYYKSKIFHDISQQLLSLTITENDQQLRQCLQSLVVFHIKYKQSADQLKSSIKQFQSIRMQLTDDDANNFDMELAKTFKVLVISNLNLLHNRAYVVNGGCVIYFFLFYLIYRCRAWNCKTSCTSFNIQYYEATVDLLLFALQCLNCECVREFWWIDSFVDLLKFISPIQLNIDQEIFVYTSQIEILKIVLDENILNVAMPSDELLPYNFTKSLGNIIIYNRLGIILFIFHYNEHVRNLFQSCWNSRKFLGILTGNQTRRKFFHDLLDDKPIRTWLTTHTNLLFILLEKKECKVVKQLLNLSPSLIHRLDEDGNDPLLYVCLKVRGRRHRLIEYLIKMESDLQRRNSKDENVFDVLQLKGNRNLLKS